MKRARFLYVVAIAAAIIAAAITFVRFRLEHDLLKDLPILRDTPVTAEVRLLQQYIRINTANPPGNETLGARFLASVLAKNGIASEVIESAPGRGSLYARIRGARKNEGLLLLNHIDVVPAPPKGWTRPPFAASVYRNSVYGRGTLDMKGVGLCELEAFIALARSGRTPERDVVFLATADEETGGEMGVAWLLAHRPDVFEGIVYALNEGGVTETMEGRPSFVGIELGTKMSVRVRLRAPDRATMERTRIALEPYVGPPDPDRVLPEVREYLHAIAPLRIEQGQYLEDVDRTIAAGKFWLLQRGYRELLQNNLAARTIESDDRGATMTVTLLNLPDEDPDARVAWLRDRVARTGAAIDEVTWKSGPAPFTSTHTPLFALLADAAQKQLGKVPVGPQILAFSSNDSRYLRARGISCYGIWPFPVDFYQTLGIHGIDERVRVDWFLSGIKLMNEIVHRYATEPLTGIVSLSVRKSSQEGQKVVSQNR
jgi:acetylornithine deacetylase/succinyl-diaminopimelate desuccinylase-like protein